MSNNMKKLFLILSALTLFPSLSWADPILRTVRTDEDSVGHGTLRLLLQSACDDDGDDDIVFGHTRLNEIRIILDSPLVIPQDCRGLVTITGSSEVETILDGSRLEGPGRIPGQLCLLNVYSNRHKIRNFTFVDSEGSGVCLFGQENEVSKNKFNGNAAVKYPIVVSQVFSRQFPQMNGQGNTVANNTVLGGSEIGLWVDSNENSIKENSVEEAWGVSIHLGGRENDFSGNRVSSGQGTGLELAGASNQVTKNTIKNNRGDGVVITGSGHEFSENEVSANLLNGISIQAHDITLTQNEIVHNGGCPNQNEILESDDGPCFNDFGAGGFGIEVNRGSHDILIGGQNLAFSRNLIQYNLLGGIVVLGGRETNAIQIEQNTISKNYGSAASIDLLEDGITLNDAGDGDEGPNHLLNFVDYVRVVPLIPAPDGQDRYWVWGLSRHGHFLDAYTVDPEDADRLDHGGADEFVDAAEIVHQAFHIDPNDYFTTGDQLTFLVRDNDGNTSEFSSNIEIGPDEDGDGILNRFEDNHDQENGDADGDGLPDSVEDRNLNGRCDAGETCADNADTDRDGLSDFVETHGDGFYNRGFDTNPLNADTDGDGLPDGREDANHNGIWEATLGETSPLSIDSDRDGRSDTHDSCSFIFNPGQEDWYCDTVGA